MLQFELWKKVLIVLAVLAGIIFALPNFFRDGALPGALPQDSVNLGLDLQGGAHVLVEADMPPVFVEKAEETAQEMRDAISNAGIRRRGRPVISGDSVSMRIPQAQDIEAARRAFQTIPRPLESAALSGIGGNDYQLTFDEGRQTFKLSLSEEAKSELTDQVIRQSLDVVRRRVDPDGIKEASVTRQGTERILIQVPGGTEIAELEQELELARVALADASGDAAEQLQGEITTLEADLATARANSTTADEIIRVINEPAVLSFHPVNQEFGQQDLRQGSVARGHKIAESADDEFGNILYAITRVPLLKGEEIAQAAPGFDHQTGEPIVTFRLNAAAGQKWGEWTRNNVGQPFAIVVDGKVLSAPVIREAILGGSGQISGNFSVESATTLALQIASGALPAKLEPLEQRTVGPELGADNIAAGKIAVIIGFIAVMVFMTVVYGKFGIFANVALIANVIMILGVLSALGATLTLPGIAGIVLTIGMAVDANVLIFERIREELSAGKRSATAIETGYEKALTAIIDANITTLIAAGILYAIGSGPIKGFAVTLGIGIITSVFTAIFLTRLFVVQWFDWTRPKTFKIMLWEMVRSGTKVPFLGWRKVALIGSAIMIVLSVGFFGIKGLNYGIDFKGGTQISAQVGTDSTVRADLGAIRSALSELDLGDVVVQGYGKPNEVLIRVEEITGGEEARNALVGTVEAAMTQAVSSFETRGVDSIGPKVSGELVTAGITAVLLAIAMVLVYIWLRFEWQFSVGAVAALGHDVVLTIGIFSLLGLEFTLSIIAAILTIVGYSLNDTVVVYDRVRENLRKFKKMPLTDLLDLSLNETLSRTLMTSITTLLALLALYFLGGASLQGFTFAMIWGVLVGTYSSIFIASPILNWLGVKRDWSKPDPNDIPAGVQFGSSDS